MEINSNQILKLAELVEDGKAKTEVTGEVLGSGADERMLKIKLPNFCNFTGEKKDDVESVISFMDLQSMETQCEKQMALLEKTKMAVKILKHEVEPKEKKAVSSKKG
jgi:hypothetical protein